MMIIWTWPALSLVRRRPAPPVAAANWIREHVPASAILYVEVAMVPTAEWYLPDYRLEVTRKVAPAAGWAVHRPTFYFREGIGSAPDAQNFSWPRGRLWTLARRRYFEVSVQPITEMVAFQEGWYGEEGSDRLAWRWMAGRSRTLLPSIKGEARLTLSFTVPPEVLREKPNVTVRVNGAVVDTFRATSSVVEREGIVPARGNAGNELVIEVDRLANTAKTRALRLDFLGWLPAR
jgi:hypothetical protein